MNLLSNDVLQYYIEHLSELPQDKQFHFVSRLYLWCQDARAEKLLFGPQKAYFTADGQPASALEAIVQQTRGQLSHGTKNAAALRQPYFEKYPRLKLYLSLLFRITFLKTIYGYDARPDLWQIVDPEELADYAGRLQSDRQAVAMLSTHAVNYLYLYQRIINQEETALDPQYFLDIGRSRYDLHQPIHLQLLIYLYTHCILGESKFYARRPAQHLDTYHAMLADLEHIMTGSFDDINLDNKFEYLVCCQLLNQPTALEAAIFAEAAQSVSSDGTYVIDRHNNNPQTTNVSLELSEHRNVLYVLAARPFKPLAAV